MLNFTHKKEYQNKQVKITPKKRHVFVLGTASSSTQYAVHASTYFNYNSKSTKLDFS